jgi:hypothetical protein
VGGGGKCDIFMSHLINNFTINLWFRSTKRALTSK